ncbi:hypothetical protein DSOL_2756 [Desulfosporosinus metallidurans]|uniref:Uncharacterized protein n=1 Tax=Desulfosporosinus metallidurans TaxID=1888891 RepID=A0A1Q8QVR2_9FIRM|nr:hypothetical protein DSOL_2756 [Desulfosporosinus metallidurans]
MGRDSFPVFLKKIYQPKDKNWRSVKYTQVVVKEVFAHDY